jgi:adenosylcobinamide-GDP ribazoletransferase
MKSRIRHFFIALQFLTIIPIKIKGSISEEDLRQSTSYFVIVGAIQGIMLLIVLNVSEKVFHSELSIFLSILAYILINGGFHLDGLSDTFDAIAVKSTGNIEYDIQKRLSVMKDSFTGAIGVIAIISVILLKYLSLKNISHLLPFTYYSSFLLMPVVSKWAMVSIMHHGRAARKEGLGSLFIGKINKKEFFHSFLSLVILCSVIYVSSYQYIPEKQYIFYVMIIAAIYLLAILWSLFCNKKFGGSTGDTIGAISELSEAIFLLMVITWSRLYI